ncbi:hypothetical protein LEP1GSC188_2327 [Leptospira weilii serovar Topaz str. LT2116]|uniref:Uncharacterized protein n=1 Tax=Leptospira weilii serovar Topaz str. LT2116 TaxID=1088540 RepID=M3GXE0_9LEPT|nr:hypothetical protein LEP1GSC188_2327 [Leptospira weilii serovar Topaz str. LT2116]
MPFGFLKKEFSRKQKGSVKRFQTRFFISFLSFFLRDSKKTNENYKNREFSKLRAGPLKISKCRLLQF